MNNTEFLKGLSKKDDLFLSGHDFCPGCLIPVIIKIVTKGSKHPLVIALASGCLQTFSTNYPKTCWKVNLIHSLYSNSATTMSGITAMYRSLKKQGKLSDEGNLNFLAIGGDGSTVDAGLGELSGFLARGDDFVYLCYDNQSYANTQGHSSSATPMGAFTATTPVGKTFLGKMERKKSIYKIVTAHQIPYFAQASPWNYQDLFMKIQTAFETNGPAFINVLSPCPNEWGYLPEKSVELARLATDTCVWPLFEVRNGKDHVVNYKPKNIIPVKKWLASQNRFAHLVNRENRWVVEKIQQEVAKGWLDLLYLENKDKIK